MLQQQHILKRHGLARRLLERGVGLVYNSVLYGLVIYCVGCVIPTPLDRAPAPTNYGPVFVTSRVTPAFGPTTEPVSSLISFSIAATDPDPPSETLTVHLFEPDPRTPGNFIYTGANDNGTMTATPEQDDPGLRLGTVNATNICLNAHSGDKFEVYAVVADRPFNTTGNPMRADGGLTDQNHWELTCM